MTEELTLTNGTINDDPSTKIFHTVTSLHINGTAAALVQVGVNGRAAGTGNNDFDDNALFETTSAKLWYVNTKW